MAKRFAWSYSAYSDYKCPRRYKYKRIDKLPEPPRYASERGTLIHKKAEHFIKGDITGMPKELAPFAKELKQYRAAKAGTEEDLAFTEAWEPSSYDDWNNVWCRVYADVVVPEYEELTIVDHKTGKIYEDSILDQAEINTLGAICHYDNVKKVNVKFLYYDLDDERSFEFKDFGALKRKWKTRIDKMTKEKDFKPCPTYRCAWCTWSSKKGGPCDAG